MCIFQTTELCPCVHDVFTRGLENTKYARSDRYEFIIAPGSKLHAHVHVFDNFNQSTSELKSVSDTIDSCKEIDTKLDISTSLEIAKTGQTYWSFK